MFGVMGINIFYAHTHTYITVFMQKNVYIIQIPIKYIVTRSLFILHIINMNYEEWLGTSIKIVFTEMIIECQKSIGW